MDGLLFDSETIYRDSFFRMLDRHGLDRGVCRFESLIGLGWAETDSRLADWYPGLDTVAFASDWRLDCRPAPGRMPTLKQGVVRLLDMLADHGIPAAIATGSKAGVAQAYLDHHGLTDRFAAVVAAEHCEFGKPHPEPFLHAAGMIGIDPAHCIVLEDSVNGIRSAHAAGAVPIFVPDLLLPTPEVRSLAHGTAPCLNAVADLCAEAFRAYA